MTFAVSIKINDGVVLAADSAATIPITVAGGAKGAANVYEHAEKVFNLRKGRPLGMVVWGIGGIGRSSMPTLVRDLRVELSGDGDNALRADYRLAEVASQASRFIHSDRYEPTYADVAPENRPRYGFIVAGFSGGADVPEEHLFEVERGEVRGPLEINPGVAGTITAAGQSEPVFRLLFGRGQEMGRVLRNDLGVPEDQVEPALRVIENRLSVPLVHPAMPLQDAIDLAEFLVDLTCRWYRFSPGAPTVGGPIEIAAITKHQGFRWVKRKHYYDPELNATEGDER